MSLTVFFGAGAAGAGEGAEGSDELPKISASRSVLLCTGAAEAPLGAGVDGISSPRRLSCKLSARRSFKDKHVAYIFARLQ